MARKKLIAANWKLYKNSDSTADFFDVFLPLVADHKDDDIVVCPPFVCIPPAVVATRGTHVHIGGQDLYWKQEGAFTGEVSGAMLHHAGCSHVIIGHSERRQYFHETDDTVNLKLEAALESKLVPIVCVGEVLEEREAGLTEQVLRRQVQGALRGMSGVKAASLVIAYEPVWAIGTGKTATPEMAVEAHQIIRAEAAECLGKETANAMRILYGGSVKPENANALMSQDEIDGALVGGASLDPTSFSKIVLW